jgi:hypothetical protein
MRDKATLQSHRPAAQRACVIWLQSSPDNRAARDDRQDGWLKLLMFH